jgi:polyisoprenoid-binding protein YceI
MNTEELVSTKWSIDTTHSEIQFKVKHLMITNVTGQFSQFDAQLQMDGDTLDGAQVQFNANTNSITTGNEARDSHLKSQDFFNSEIYPLILVNGTLTAVEDYKPVMKLSGEMTICETTKPVEFDVEYFGKQTDPWGNEKMGFSISGVINRKDFGLVWNSTLETGGVLVSDEVKIIAEVQLTRG